MNIIKIILILTILINCLNFNAAAYHQETGWKKSMTKEMINPNTKLTFRVYIKQQNLQLLESTVQDISSPKSANYGKYLTIDQVTSIVEPTEQTIQSVNQWLQQHNPISVEFTANKDCMIVKMSKQNIEKLMNVKLEKYTHPIGKSILRSAIDPITPSHLINHIDLITGISHFPIYKKQIGIESTQSSTSSSESSSSELPAGLQIISIKGAGEFMKVTYQPSCSPSCNGKYFPMEVTVTALNQVINQTITTGPIVPTCQIPSGSNAPVCTVNANAFVFQPSHVSIKDTVSNEQLAWEYPVVSTPIVLPQTIKDYYGVPTGYIVTHPNATQCVVEFEQQYYSPSDLTTFFNEMGLTINTTVTVIGPNDVTNPGVEASLDIQYIMGVAVGSATTFWSIEADTPAEIDDILQWAIAINGMTNPPLVNSLSYGMTEGNVDTYLGTGYMARSEIEFQKVALRGITIVIASGDSGAGDLGGPPMGESNCNTLHADWPSNSPYVTSVGSIYFTPYADPICYQPSASGGVNCQENPIGEVGVSIDYGLFWTSGGGFSNFTTTAFYQQQFVDTYLDRLESQGLTPPSSIWNSKGRAYPDFSTVGHGLYVINQGEWLSVDGTSASAPIYAGLISILNDIRLNNGQPQLGFLNPLFYEIAHSHPEAFYDVIVGNNRCGLSNSSPICCDYGYSAVAGFDTVSGIGRPDMSVLMEIITSF